MTPTVLRILMIWIYSCGTIAAIIVLIRITETLTLIIMAAVIVVFIMIGPQEVMVNRMMIPMTSRTTMT